jgi:hypothetical protein
LGEVEFVAGPVEPRVKGHLVPRRAAPRGLRRLRLPRRVEPEHEAVAVGQPLVRPRLGGMRSHRDEEQHRRDDDDVE